MVWRAYEHLLLATVAFALVVKCFLNKAGKYQLTEDDNAQIDCFESLADTPEFFTPPDDAESSWDSKWARLLEARRSEMSSEAFERACVNALAAQQQMEGQGHDETA